MNRTYKTEFPDYAEPLRFPADWIDTSSKNDVCPSFEKDHAGISYKIFCDFETFRVDGAEYQFIVGTYCNSKHHFEFIGEFDTLEQALNLVNEKVKS